MRKRTNIAKERERKIKSPDADKRLSVFRAFCKCAWRRMLIEEKVNSSSVKTIKDFSESSQDSCTRITSTMTITGDIKSSDNVHIHGQVFGNVKTNATVYATDLILGNVSAQSGFFKGARIKGRVSLTDDFALGENSTIVGDVKCKNAHIAGKIKGNCDIEASANLTSTALLSGDIITSDISTEQGAKIIGSISTGIKDLDLDAEFDFGGEL